MMINQLTIQNFQSHENTVLEFAPGLNIIVGSSNSGKTALLRAFEWVRNNRPLGTSLIRSGTDSASVSVETDSHTIERSRGKRNNCYTITGGGSAGELEALGASVPQQVTDALGLVDINVSGQLDKHYLVLDAPGKIAAAVNDVIHLERAQSAISTLNSLLRELNSTQKTLSQRESDLEEQLHKFAAFEIYAIGVDKAQGISKAVSVLGQLMYNLLSSQRGLMDLEKQIDSIKVPKNASITIDACEQAVVDDAQFTQRKNSLTILLTNLQTITTDIDGSVPPTVGDLFGEFETILPVAQRLQRGRHGLKILIESIDSADNTLDEACAVVSDLTVDCENLLIELDACPFCQRPLDKAQREVILEGD